MPFSTNTTSHNDEYFNRLASKNLSLNSFDMVILAQAANIGALVTEDEDILFIRRQEAFLSDPVMSKVSIKQ